VVGVQQQEQWPPPVPDRLAQASDIVRAQIRCSAATAVAMIEKRAELIGCCVGDVVTAVIDNVIRFDNQP
jgi:hypothetical protein